MTTAVPTQERLDRDMLVTYRLHCLTEALEPVSHMQGTDGNEAKVNRAAVLTPDGIRVVPFLSGNAIRHRMVRRPVYLHLCRVWGLSGSLTKDHLQFLFHGGRNREKTAGRFDMRHTSDLFRLFPAAKLLGCCLPGGIISGALLVWRGMLACRENERRFAATAPDGWWGEGFDLPAASELVESSQYVRGTPDKSVPELDVGAGGEESESNPGQMIVRAEGVVPGSLFWHGFVAQRVSRKEIGALLLALRLWQQDDGTVGGMGGKGHGRLKLHLGIEREGVNEQDAIEAYLAHIESVRDEGVDFLRGLFDRQKDAQNGRAKGKAKAAVASKRHAAQDNGHAP